MKIGVKEFRKRFSELAEGEEPVLVTKNGRVVGRYAPMSIPKPRDPKLGDELEDKRQKFLADWKARDPDWRAKLAEIGLDEQGELIE